MLFAYVRGNYKLEKIKIGEKIREVRKSRNLTQQKLAEMADIGIMYMGEIERGVKFPSMNVFVKIIEALDVSADYILRDEIHSGKEYVFDEITKKLEDLSPKQRKAVSDILDAYIKNL